MIYVGVGIIGYFFATLAEKRRKKGYVLAMIVLLTFISGFRGYSVGIDTINFTRTFELIARDSTEVYWESSFTFICRLLENINENPTFLLFVFSLLINALIIFRLWDFKDTSSMRMMFLVYYCCFFFSTLNIMRQWCAVAIMFYFTRYLQKGKYLPFIVSIAIGFLFHRSALLGTVFFTFELLQWKKISKKNRAFIIALIIAGLALFTSSLTEIMRYEHYFTTASQNIGFLIIAEFIFCVGSFAIFRKRIVENKKGLRGDNYSFNCVFLAYLLGMMLTGVEYFFPFMGRMGLYFYIFETVFFGTLVKKEKMSKLSFEQLICSVCILVFTFYPFIMSLVVDGHGVLPYVFIWNY